MPSAQLTIKTITWVVIIIQLTCFCGDILYNLHVDGQYYLHIDGQYYTHVHVHVHVYVNDQYYLDGQYYLLYM